MIKNLKNFESLHVLKSNYIGYLSYIWKNKPYAVPITYHYNNDENCIISYSGEGHKIDAMRVNNKVSIVITQIESVNTWQSILVHGKFEELVGTHAKQQLHKFSQGVKKKHVY